MNDSSGRERDRRDATDPDVALARTDLPTGWTAPIIDAPRASGAAHTEPGFAIAEWGSDDWAWTDGHDVDEVSPDVHDPSAGDEAPTSPGVQAVPADGDPPSRGSDRSRDGRRVALGIGTVACFAILIGALAGTMDVGGPAARPKRAASADVPTTLVAPTTSTTLEPTTTLLLPTTVVSSPTVVVQPVVTVPPTSPPSTCNIVTQLLGCR